MSKLLTIAIYLRISREDDKDSESQSISNQRACILDYINAYLSKNCAVSVVEYIDDGYTGTTFDRPQFKRLVSDCKNKKIDVVIVKDTSRLGRHHIWAGYYSEEFFVEHNIRFIAINDGIDTASEEQNDFIPIKLAFDEFYPRDISKKVKSALVAKKKAGKHLAPTAPYGYKKDPEDNYKLLIDNEVRKNVEKIFKLALENYSDCSIANILTSEGVLIPSVYKNLNRGKKSCVYGAWCSRTVGGMLDNPTYMGCLTQGRMKKLRIKSKKIVRTDKSKWIIAKDSHEPIIDKATFEKVQEIRESKQPKIKIKYDDLLGGLLFCKECGHTLGINRNGVGTAYVVCNYYRKYSKYGACTSHSMKYADLEKEVLRQLKTIYKNQIKQKEMDKKIVDVVKKNQALDKKKDLITQHKITCSKLDNQLENAYLDKLNGIITDSMYLSVSKKLSEQLNTLKQNIDTLEKEQENKKNRVMELKLLERELSQILTFEKPSKSLLMKIIKKIEITEAKKIEIYLNIRGDVRKCVTSEA